MQRSIGGNINSIGLSFTIIASIFLILLPRRHAVLPILTCTCYITIGQGIDIAGLNLYVLRILIFFGWIRLVFRNEISSRKLKFNVIDKAIIWWLIASIVTYFLLRQNFDALVNRLGLAYNAAGLYFLLRYLIYDFEDIERTIKYLAFLVAPLACLMLVEKFSGRNIFSIFGGVDMLSAIREGSVRCQGPFRHSILAGSFGVTLIPLFVSLWFKTQNARIFSIIGFIAANVITITARASGPIMIYFVIIVGFLMWKYRIHLRVVRWGALFLLICLHILMKAPVWFLIDRSADVLGASGHAWYRAAVIDRAIKHFGEWWLLGTDYTAHWGLTILPLYPNKVDITNHYINIGVEGGLISMVLFILIVYYSFQTIGYTLEKFEEHSFYRRMSLWCLGVALFSHAVNFLAVAYFDQIIVLWYLLLAMISSAADTDMENL